MSKEDKLIERLKSIPVDFTYQEAKTLTGHFGYAEYNKGSTSGSRALFCRKADKKKIMLHKPHPGNIMKKYAVRSLLEQLVENGDINE